MQKYLISRGRNLALDKPLMMGVLNVTPDSFSDGGRFKSARDAVTAALKMVDDGAQIIDVGGESTGPLSKDVSAETELKRVLPVIETLRKKTKAWISIDTWKAEVARRAVLAGADMVNDVTALRGDPAMAGLVAELKVPVVLMYSKDSGPRTSLEKKDYGNVVATILSFLRKRLEYAKKAGIALDKCVIDPGMGAFVSSDAKYSLQMLKNLQKFKVLGRPLMVGASRKSFIGKVLDLPVGERTEGGLACLAYAVMNGADIVRTHDVRASVRVIRMLDAINKS
jgi:dihydropteroate synthase